jgi:hypothetical protein
MLPKIRNCVMVIIFVAYILTYKDQVRLKYRSFDAVYFLLKEAHIFG